MGTDKETTETAESDIKNIRPNVAGLLCYLGGWISGIVFLVIEQTNWFVRFNALQSIITFGTLTIAGTILGNIPIVGQGFAWIIFIFSFVLWLVLMLKAYAGETYKLPLVGNLAEKLANDSMKNAGRQQSSIAAQASSGTESTPAPAPTINHKQNGYRTRYYSPRARAGRIVGSVFAIAWDIVLIVFFNFYSQYIAYYQLTETGSHHTWQMTTLITPDFNLWVPIVTVTLIISIVGHFLIILVDKYILRQAVRLILNVFGLITVVSLLLIFPFNFGAIPDADFAFWLQFGVTTGLIFGAVGFGIGVLVRIIKMVIDLFRGNY